MLRRAAAEEYALLILTLIVFILLVAADLLTKQFICPAVIGAGGRTPFIPGVIRFEYTENTGMAWGLFKNATLVLTVTTALACALIVYFIISKRKTMPALMRFALAAILAGAVGNLIDRIFLGYVRDFIAFDFISFPIFNFADSCVTVGAVLLGISLLLTKKGRSFLKSLDGDGKAKKGSADKPEEPAEGPAPFDGKPGPADEAAAENAPDKQDK